MNRYVPGSVEPIFEVDASAGDQVFALPRGFASGRTLTVRRSDSSANTVTVTVPTGQYINGELDATRSVAPGSEIKFLAADPGIWRAFTSGGAAGSGAEIAADPALTARYSRQTRRDVRNDGSVADGATNVGPAFLTALTAAKNTARTPPFGGGDPVGTVTIELPAGDHVITDVRGFLGQEAPPGKRVGIRFVGQGVGITTVIFKPATAADLCFNDYWLFVQMENLSFTAVTAGCTFMHSATTHNAQNYRFLNVAFNKWKYIFLLEGNNNNSEFCFVNCTSSGTETDGAWLKIPDTNSSDQFLNYWWFGGSHQSTSAPLIDAAKGGSFHVYGLDLSDWGSALAGPGKIFNLRGIAHGYGVCNLQVSGLRVEGKSAYAGLLYSEWPSGTVSFRGVDWSSQVGNVTYGNIIDIQYVNGAGPIYSFKDSTLAGGIGVTFAIGDWAFAHKVIVEDCFWYQRQSPSDVVTYDASGAGPNVQSTPPVVFSRCMSASGGSVFNASGQAVWDATIGYRGGLVQSLQQRSVSVRGTNGVPSSGPLTVRLPTGAIITGLEWLSPAGAVAEGDGGTWTLATTEGSPTSIATATVAGALSAGHDTNASPTVPFLCDTSARATVTLTPTNVSQENRGGGMLLIKGYW